MKRRTFLTASLATTAALPFLSAAQPQIPEYEQRDWSGNTPLRYPDPDLIALDPQLQADLITADRIGHVDLYTLRLKLGFVPRIAVVLEDELLVQRTELGTVHRCLRGLRNDNVGRGARSCI